MTTLEADRAAGGGVVGEGGVDGLAYGGLIIGDELPPPQDGLLAQVVVDQGEAGLLVGEVGVGVPGGAVAGRGAF